MAKSDLRTLQIKCYQALKYKRFINNKELSDLERLKWLEKNQRHLKKEI
jgi:hypothetical protein